MIEHLYIYSMEESVTVGFTHFALVRHIHIYIYNFKQNFIFVILLLR